MGSSNMSSALRSPLPEAAAENPTSLRSPLRSPLPYAAAENRTPLPPLSKSPLRSPLRSPFRPPENSIPSLPQTVPELVMTTNRLNRDDRQAADARAVPGGGRHLALPETLRKVEVRMAAFGLRVSAVVLCMISFSVMAADKTKGWAGDSYGRYEEYRYAVGVNVIVFLYSGYQVFAHVFRRIKGRDIIHRPTVFYFDLAMDQILAYLMISASSAAASRNNVWVSRFGGDDFTKMISVSIAMSFLAFIALALSSIISAYNTFSWSL